jgi:hypothetical protein
MDIDAYTPVELESYYNRGHESQSSIAHRSRKPPTKKRKASSTQLFTQDSSIRTSSSKKRVPASNISLKARVAAARARETNKTFGSKRLDFVRHGSRTIGDVLQHKS